MKYSIKCPADKSITHRLFLLAAIAKGTSIIKNPLLGNDCITTLKCIKLLGCDIYIEKNFVKIISKGYNNWVSPEKPLDLGNSGTTARLMIGLLSANEKNNFILYGDKSLSNRPMDRVTRLLIDIGANIYGKEDAKFLPIFIKGQKLRKKDFVLDIASAQVKSAIILANLYSDFDINLTLPAGSRNHSEKILNKMGPYIKSETDGKYEYINLKSPVNISNFNYKVPGDPSSAVFFAALAAMSDNLEISIKSILKNETRIGFIEVFKMMEIDYDISDILIPDSIEPEFDLIVRSTNIFKSVDIDSYMSKLLIDEIMILAVMAAFANGKSIFRDITELKFKESDRLAKTIEIINKIGAKAFADGDDLIVYGPLKKINCFQFDSCLDHRMAMIAIILEKLSKVKCKIIGRESVSVSFPEFQIYMKKINYL